MATKNRINWQSSARVIERNVTFQEILDILKEMKPEEQLEIISEILCNATDETINGVRTWLAE